MKKFLFNLFLVFVPVSKWRKLLRHKYLGISLPVEWIEERRADAYENRVIYSIDDSAYIIKNELNKDKPSLITRFGTVELDIMRQFVNRKSRKINYVCTDNMSTLAGFFPIDTYHLTRFSSEMLEILPDVDVLGIRHLDEEFEAIKMFMPKTKLIDIYSYEIHRYGKNPWTKALEGKRVLVISPFEATIREQYKKRKSIHKSADFLPEFELKTLKAVQGFANSKENLPFKTWFEALDFMKEQINNIDFDIAVIGAGAYGMFLAHHCKLMGKKAIHSGGATQLIFGIAGQRWDECNIYNEHWTRPIRDELPKGAEKVRPVDSYW